MYDSKIKNSPKTLSGVVSKCFLLYFVSCTDSPVGRVCSAIPFVFVLTYVCPCLVHVCTLARGEAEFVARVTLTS